MDLSVVSLERAAHKEVKRLAFPFLQVAHQRTIDQDCTIGWRLTTADEGARSSFAFQIRLGLAADRLRWRTVQRGYRTAERIEHMQLESFDSGSLHVAERCALDERREALDLCLVRELL